MGLLGLVLLVLGIVLGIAAMAIIGGFLIAPSVLLFLVARMAYEDVPWSAAHDEEELAAQEAAEDAAERRAELARERERERVRRRAAMEDPDETRVYVVDPAPPPGADLTHDDVMQLRRDNRFHD